MENKGERWAIDQQKKASPLMWQGNQSSKIMQEKKIERGQRSYVSVDTEI